MFQFEKEAKIKGFEFIAGVDEAGRGPLAGPVVAAAVVLKDFTPIPELRDSKEMSPKQRDRVFELIKKSALGFGKCNASLALILTTSVFVTNFTVFIGFKKDHLSHAFASINLCG